MSVVSGFSQSTGMPRSRQALTCSSWALPGVAISTASTSGSLIASIGSSDHPGADRGGDLLGLVGEEVVDHGDLGAADPLAQRVHVERPHHADAEHGDSEFTRHGTTTPMSMLAPLQELR